MNDLLIIIPIYNEENCIAQSYDSIRQISNDCKIMYINDGSTDKSIDIINNLENKDKNIYHITFSKNFGKEAAIFCGLKESTNLNINYVCIMDVDGQDPFELIQKMYNEIINGKCDAVACRRKDRKGEGIIRSYFSRLFYKLMNLLISSNVPEGARDFIMMKLCFRDALLLYNEKCRFFKALYNSIGYDIKWIEYENIHIDGRKSKWSFGALISYAIEGIVSHTNKLLIVSVWFGFVFCIVSFISLLFVFFRTFIFGDKVAGWTSTICIILLCFGLMYLFIGIVGLYISKNYTELKNRPTYIIREKSGHFAT